MDALSLEGSPEDSGGVWDVDSEEDGFFDELGVLEGFLDELGVPEGVELEEARLEEDSTALDSGAEEG